MVLRSILLFLSRQRHLRRWIETSSTAQRLTARFVAGRTLEQGLEVCRRLNRRGILATFDHLGENVTSVEQASKSRDAYIQALHRIAEEGIEATVSVKLTQFGLDLSDDICHDNVERLVSTAKQLGGFVEVDMESNEYVDRTLKLVSELHDRYGCVRGVIQAYLYRSQEDIQMLCAKKIPVRLCKGAYQESPPVALPRKSDVNAQYLRLMHFLLEHGTYPGIATHDENMINEACCFAEERRISPDQFEFQMLYGIRRDLQRRLVSGGHRLRLYVPYGDEWYPYLMRRLAERPANLFFLMRNLMRG
jgi:proline dehydrogenase